MTAESLRAKFVTANTSKASSLFSDRIPASMMREPVQTLCYRARHAEMLFSWNDEAPVWGPKFRALLHEASCTSFFLCFCNPCRVLIFLSRFHNPVRIQTLRLAGLFGMEEQLTALAVHQCVCPQQQHIGKQCSKQLWGYNHQ